MAINTNTSLFNHNGYLTTYTGIEVYLPRPTVEMICIEDISRSLSNLCHWNGQTQVPFTIAQHSVMTCWMAPEEVKREALMHDAPEAYLGDVIKPLKILIGEQYAILEERFKNVICSKYDLRASFFSDEVKPFDKGVQKMEFEYLFEKNPTNLIEFMHKHTNMHLPDVWNHQQAEIMFMLEFKKWFPQ